MFKKIVSNLPFSPSLIGQLGFYAKRLQKEEITRKLGLIFVALTLIVQSLVIFQPPESANASNASDMVYGGVGSIDVYLAAYDANSKNLRDVMNQLGITRSEISSTKLSSWRSTNKLSWGFASSASYAQGERQYSIKDATGKIVTTVYSRPQSLRQDETKDIPGWVGYSKQIGWFAIMQACGNLVTEINPTPITPEKCAINQDLTADDPACRTCPGKDTIWADDPSCAPNIVNKKTAINISQGNVDAKSVIAEPNDRIIYTIETQNTGFESTTTKLEDNIADVLEYSILLDNGGGLLDESSGMLSWGYINLPPGAKQSRSFLIRIKSPIPITAQGVSNPMSYDCIITNVFGDSIDIKINCPTQKTIEKTVTSLPTTGPAENLLFSGLVLAVITYFYARTRQMKKEIKLIKQNAISGTL